MESDSASSVFSIGLALLWKYSSGIVSHLTSKTLTNSPYNTHYFLTTYQYMFSLLDMVLNYNTT